MKQKNLILMVVAVGCGLVAALLTSQMSARQSKVETEDVLVAAKDLPVGTMITEEDLPKMIRPKKLPKDALPPLFVRTEKELLNKRLSRAVRAEELFNPQDLNTGGVVTLPPGMDMMSMSVSLPDAVAGFVTPGCRVDILGTAKAGQRQVAFPLLTDMLVLAVDAATALPKDAPTFAALNTVSFAVDRKQALLIQLAKSRGCNASLVLRHTGKQGIEEQWKPEDVLKLLEDGIVPGNPVETKEQEPVTPADAPKGETVSLPVATEDIPAGTELTADVLKKFSVKEVPAPAPANAVTDLESISGKVLVNGVAANQWVPKGFVGNVTAKPTPREEFNPGAKGGPVAEEPKDVTPGRRTHDVTVQTGTGHKTFRYEEKAPGEWTLVGELNKNADLPSAAPEKTEPKPEPKAEGEPKKFD